MDSLERGLSRPRGGITPLEEPPRSLGAFGANADDLASTKVGETSRGTGVPGLSGIPELGQGVSRDGDGSGGGQRPWWGLGFGSHGASDGPSTGMSGMSGMSGTSSGSAYQQQQRFIGRVDMADLSGSKKPGGAVDTRRWRRQPLRGEVRDTSAFVIVAAFKVFRIMLLWIVLFCVDRLFQEWYTRRVLAAGVAGGGTDAGGVALASSPGGGGGGRGRGAENASDVCPPPLWAMVVAALVAEALVLGIVFGALAFAAGSFKADVNTFVLDAPLLRRIATDYATSTAMILVLGVLLASVISSEHNFRYSEDGLRAIRAFSLVLLLCAALLTTFSP